jgi:AraC-like DNA-binding protein
MKVIPFSIPKDTREAFRVQVDELPRLYDHLHQHPEIQLTCIRESEGTLLAGDYIGRFAPGDVFVLGSNQPHVFRNDPVYGRKGKIARAISVFFDESTLGEAFWNLPEISSLKYFIRNSAAGFRLAGKQKQEVASLLDQMINEKGIQRLIIFLRILSCFEKKKALQVLSGSTVNKNLKSYDGKRLNLVLEFTFREFHRPIELSEIASLANLTPQAFCKYFKTRTRKTYVQFLNEIRIQHALRLLHNDEESIAAIAFKSGFSNLSHFNRTFKSNTGTTPMEYLKHSAFRMNVIGMPVAAS